MTAISDSVKQKYELVIGLEVHAQLATKSKIFSSDPANFGGGPNEHTNPVSLGLPGTLPMLNLKVVEYAVKMGLATHCEIIAENRFDRKNYFYADLPKGYQITQDALPVCKNGYITVKSKDGSVNKIRLNRIHMEEDAGKSIHDQDENDSLIDLNRAGVPLIEIVSEPNIRSAEEAALYLTEIRKLVRYLEICDGNMEEGSLRCDANISVRIKGETEYGNRCEVKNLNSIRNLQRAIDFEFQRQIKLIEKGEKIEQNTLNFDAATGTTSPLRSKEMANDYRYFPEPDLPPVILTDEHIAKIHAELPELPEKKIERYTVQFGLSDYDASVISTEKEFADYYDAVVKFTANFKAAANWLTGPVKSYLNENAISISGLSLKPERLAGLIELVDEKKISYSVAAKQVLPVLIHNPQKSAEETALELNLLADTDEEALEHIINEVLAMHQDKVIAYHNGKKGVLGLFMGEVMKKSGGKTDPQKANKLIIEKLKKVL